MDEETNDTATEQHDSETEQHSETQTETGSTETATETKTATGKHKAKQGGKLSLSQQMRNVFTAVSFAHLADPERPNVFSGFRGGISRLLGTATIKIAGLPLAIETTVYKKIGPDGTVSISVTDPGLTATTEEMATVYAAELDRIRDRFIDWRAKQIEGGHKDLPNLTKEDAAGKRQKKTRGGAGTLTADQRKRLGM